MTQKQEIMLTGSATGERELALKHAILIYAPPRAFVQHQGNQEAQAYATLHNVALPAKEGARPQIMAGVPLSRRSLVELAAQLAPNEAHGFLPPHVLCVGADHIIWWSPPTQRMMWFNADKPIGARGGKTPHPGLVFAVVGSEWYVFAVKGTARPNPATALYQAPYFNVWERGRICTGNVSLPKFASIDQTEAYEKAFFGSYFTHPNIHAKGKLTRYPNGPFSLWADLLSGKHKRFPNASLVPEKAKLGQIINKVTKEGKL